MPSLYGRWYKAGMSKAAVNDATLSANKHKSGGKPGFVRRLGLVGPVGLGLVIALVLDLTASVTSLASVSYTHLTLPTTTLCRSRWSPYH